MQEELQVHHLPRYEKKRLVKGWHAIQAPSNVSRSTPTNEPSEDDRIGRSGSMRSLFATPPGALAYNFEQTGTWRSTSNSTRDGGDLHDQQQGEKLPKTVGQVKHAYRARARREEACDASNATRKRDMILEQRRGTRWRQRDLQMKTKTQQPSTMEPHQDDTTNGERNEDNVSPEVPQDEFGSGLQLLDLSVDEIMTNTPYREEVLRQIRHQLSSGGEVLLQSDCSSVNDTVKNTRLMLQTLCTQSLAYCVRDQNVVPDTGSLSSSLTRLALRLIPRHPSICLTTSL